MITKVNVEGFRGISGGYLFKPERLTVLTGRNGLGKTTFFDAIDWCLFGEVSRLGPQPHLIKNLYNSNQHSSVEVALELGHDTVLVKRTESGLTLNGSTATERDLAEALIADPQVFPPYLRDLGKQVRTVTYLPQEQIREFVTAGFGSERKALLQGLLGVPNAGVVESSIKRIRDNFSARQKTLIEEVDNVANELRQIASSVEFDPTVDQDANNFLARFRTLSNDTTLTMDRVRSMIEADLASSETDARLMENALAEQVEVESTVAQVNKELGVIKQRQADLLKEMDISDLKSREINGLIEKARLLNQSARQGLDAQQARVNNLSILLVKKQRFEELRMEIARCEQQRDEVTIRAAELKKSAEVIRCDLETTEKLASDYRRELKLTQERDAIESRRKYVHTRLSSIQNELKRNQVELGEAKRAQAETSIHLEQGLRAKNAALAAHEAALRTAQRSGQLTDARNKLIGLLEIGDINCPLCGKEYGTHDNLLEHLKNNGNPSDVNAQLQTASKALGAAETNLLEVSARQRLFSAKVKELSAESQQFGREIAEATKSHDTLNSALQQIGKPSESTPSAQILNKVDELRAVAEKTNLELGRVEAELRSILNALGRLISESENIMIGTKESEFSGISVELISEAREKIGQDQRAFDDQEKALRDLRNRHSAVEAGLSDVRAQIAAAEGRSTAEQQRMERILDEFKRQCESIGLGDFNLHAVAGELQRRATLARTQIAKIRDALSMAKEIERRQIVNESVTKQRDLQNRLEATQESLSTLHRAQNRFREVADSLAARSKTEAESAGAHHLAAIQECVNDLYPHRHLNEIAIDFAEGELLVKDRWLKRGVRPHDYSSTGQANVLALSVFLGLALRQKFSPARFLLLDEPVQNLDDLHFLAFLTLLKRVAMSRQVIISTADSNITEILRRQLRSWSYTNRTWCEYEWTGFHPETGPTIKRHEGRRIAVA